MASDSEDEIPILNMDDVISSESDESDDDFSTVRQWVPANSNTPAPPRFNFKGNPGIKVQIDDISNPLNFFELFINDNLLQYIVDETNFYATKQIEDMILSPKSRVHQWVETNVNEMKLFFALVLLQGVVKKPVQSWMWSKKPILCTPYVSTVMSEKRFSLLMKFLHFSRNVTTKEDHPNKLKKIENIFTIINDNFKKVYIPERDISIDESLMPYQGRLGWIQFIPTKRARFGIKMFHLCESSSGYIWNTIIYTGKETSFDTFDVNYGIATKTVLTLLRELLGKGYCLTIDNFYSSPELAEILLRNQTDVYGTLNLNRKNIPPILKVTKLKKGDVLSYQKGKMFIIKWQDKKTVTMLSTIHNPKMVEINKKSKIIEKPECIVDYNQTMGGVDKADQCLSYYPSTRSQQKKYYKKIFRYILDQVVFNAFVICQKSGSDIKLLDFRMNLVEALIASNKTQIEIPIQMEQDGVDNRLVGRHFPNNVISVKGKRKAPTRKCVVCASKFNQNGNRVRRESRYECTKCNVGLCVVPCFEIFHTQNIF